MLEEFIKARDLSIIKKGMIIVNEPIDVGSDQYVLLKRTQCTRCETYFYPKMNFNGEVRDNKLCPFCKSPYWKYPRERIFKKYKSTIFKNHFTAKEENYQPQKGGQLITRQ